MTLNVGDRAPEFSLPNHEGTLRSISGKTIIFFYPAAFTPGCTGEVCDFRDRYSALAEAGYDVVGISPDPVSTLADFAAEHHLTYPLLSDEDHAIADAYGAWGIKKNYGKEYVGLIRSTVVVGEDGLVEAAWYNVRAKGHAERVQRELLG